MNNHQPDYGRMAYQYLALNNVLSRADLIMGFGNFDQKVPLHCLQLYQQGLAPLILFTGGRGSGTGDVQGAESLWFKKIILQENPDFPLNNVILETESTNTPENVHFSKKTLESHVPSLLLGKDIKKVIFVTTAYRQRRVGLTLKKIIPELDLISAPPTLNYGQDQEFFTQKGYDFAQVLKGEIERIINYGKLGYICQETIAPEVLSAFQHL
ncbi:MAG: YdcF family protein [Pseudomonadota bacterium]